MLPDLEMFIGLVVLTIVLAPLVLAIVAINKAGGARDRTRRLEKMLQAQAERIDALVRQVKSLGGGEGVPPAATPEAEAAPAPPETAQDRTPLSAPSAPAEPDSGDLEGVAEPAQALPVPPAAGSRAESLEEALTSRWLVWLGAVTIALGGIFLVKYAVELGVLGPEARVGLGFLLGIALTLGGEALRRRPLQRAIARIRPNYVPPALTASGLFVAFASVYVAYGLYDLLPALIAFVALATLALLAIGLSLLQGWFVALLGLLGAFITPVLVASDEPSAWTLFAYLLVIVGACIALVRYRAWWWLAAAALGGAVVWPWIWIVAAWSDGDAIPLGLYLLLASAAFLSIRDGQQPSEGPRAWFAAMKALPLPEKIGWIAAGLFAFTAVAAVDRADHEPSALILFGLLVGLYIGQGRRASWFDGLALLAGLMVLLLVASWPLPASVEAAPPLFTFGELSYGTLPGAPLVPPALSAFIAAGVIYGLLVAVGSFVALWGARRPEVFAAASAGSAVLLLALAYWRLVGFAVDFRWAAIALLLAGVGLLAAMRVAAFRDSPGYSTALGYYAAAVVACVSLGATMTLEQAWLTVALSLQLPALGWIAGRLPERSLQLLAAALAAVVLIRLVFNYNLLDYAHEGRFGWVIYGYGIPALTFFWSAWQFRRVGAERLVSLLQGGGVIFSVLLVSLQLRLLVAGSLAAPHYGLLEQSLQSIAWLSIGYLLGQHYNVSGNRVALHGARTLFVLSALQVVLLQLVAYNPYYNRIEVGDYPLVNLLFLAYAVPAAFAIRCARDLPKVITSRGVGVAAPLALLLLFAYISLEVRRAFHGSLLWWSKATSDAEFYSYSAAWLAFAALLLALGIYRRARALRYASGAVLLAVILKVFLLDMADLTGLYRVASFLGLGLALVGVGYLYQRFVFRPEARPTGSAAGA